MNFTRRGFLGLASAVVAEAVASRIVPPQVVHVAEPLERRLIESSKAFEVERFVMPFASELDGFVEIVEPGGVVSFVARSQILFRPERLIFSACNLESFELLPFVDADGESDMLEPVPASMFDPRYWGARLPLGIVYPGNEIVLSMRNVSKGDREVRAAAMIGSRAR